MYTSRLPLVLVLCFALWPSTAIPGVTDWDTYPTYSQYTTLMTGFAASHPALCSLQEVGTTTNGRKLLFAKISDQVNVQENEPEVMLISTLHGDELAGYVLMLRLIDYLLSNYGTDATVTHLVNSLEIWISPLANPDGTYAGGDSTVWLASRGNANAVDLNRNFPDPGGTSSSTAVQVETTALINLATQQHFTLSVSFHSGFEFVVYPWNRWRTATADEAWWIAVSQAYASLAQTNPGYMLTNDGVTNGADWYVTIGTHSDYMNYFHSCREFEVFLSDTKMLPESELDAHWHYNIDSIRGMLAEALNGIHGRVTDGAGTPLDAIVTVVGHDADNSQVRTDPDVGDYHRPIAPGTYTLRVDANTFPLQTISGVTVTAGSATVVNVRLGSSPSLAPLHPLLLE